MTTPRASSELRIHDVQPSPETGQFWAFLNPLRLARVLFPGEVTTFELWGPLSKDEGAWLLPFDRDQARFLWSDETAPNDQKYRVGDVVMVEMSLWFAGPRTNDREVQVLADHTGVIGSDHTAGFDRFIQRGPAEVAETRFERKEPV